MQESCVSIKKKKIHDRKKGANPTKTHPHRELDYGSVDCKSLPIWFPIIMITIKLSMQGQFRNQADKTGIYMSH